MKNHIVTKFKDLTKKEQVNCNGGYTTGPIPPIKFDVDKWWNYWQSMGEKTYNKLHK